MHMFFRFYPHPFIYVAAYVTSMNPFFAGGIGGGFQWGPVTAAGETFFECERWSHCCMSFLVEWLRTLPSGLARDSL